MITTRNIGLAAGLLAAVLSCVAVWPGRAAAQQTAPLPAPTVPPSSAPLSVEEIQGCLCLQPQLQPLQDTWLARQHDYDEHQQQLANLDQQVKAQRQQLNPEDAVGQQVLKDLMTQEDELRAALQSQYLPAVNQARDAYNAAVERYNGACTRPRYSVDETKARQNLVCPAQ
ncbi:MAG TPA: hypothetical protein VMT54_22875 [Candidatus Cybelea sp.]|nr:hypothetical protein [Candidatus Cybelea sp.]